MKNQLLYKTYEGFVSFIDAPPEFWHLPCMVEVTFDSINLNCKVSKTGEVSVILIEGSQELLDVPSYYSLKGILDTNSKISITEIDDQRYDSDTIDQFFHNKIPIAKDHLDNFNRNLYHLISQNSSDGHLVSLVGFEPLTTKVICKPISEGFEFSLNILDPITFQLRMKPLVKLVLPPPAHLNSIGPIEIVGKLIEVSIQKNIIKYRFKSLKMQYNNKNVLETYVIFHSTREMVSLYLKSVSKFVISGFRIPLILLSLVAYTFGSLHQSLDIFIYLVGLFALFMLNISANLFNDYFDELSKSDAYNFQTQYTALPQGGSRYIQSRLFSSEQVLSYAILSLFIGSLTGIYLVFLVDNHFFIYLGIAGAFFAFFYSSPPLKLGYRGFGEISILLSWGILPYIGGKLLQTGSVNTSFIDLILLIILSYHILSIVIIRSIGDQIADKTSKKYTLVVIFGENLIKRIILIGYAVMVIIPIITLFILLIELLLIESLLIVSILCYRLYCVRNNIIVMYTTIFSSFIIISLNLILRLIL
jgi:1,4-dihydroxy-2-naphthoate polyprenyltransferase